MRIGIFGKGRVGSAIATGWQAANHDVKSLGRASQTEIEGLVQWADILVLAVPYAAISDLAAALAPATGKIIIDCTNPIAIGPDGLGLAVGHSNSGAETLQALLPDARIVKTLNQVGAEIMANTSGFGHPPVQFYASDDAEAKEIAAGLLADLGFEALDAGGLSKARILEPFALVWINQAMAQGHGRDWAFGAMPRGAAS